MKRMHRFTALIVVAAMVPTSLRGEDPPTTADDDRWEISVFGRNITDEENLKGGIDFNNNTGFVNDRRIWGASLKINFGTF